VAALAEALDLRFPVADPPRVLLNGQDVTDEIHTESCGKAASQVAANAAVRQALLGRQREFRRFPGLVADGRDMGTVVFPDAEFKVFLTASAEIRATRRYNQLIAKGIDVSLASLAQEIQERDLRDSERAHAPLVAAEGAVMIDSSDLSIDEVVASTLRVLNR
jgi:cytidylate kinase